MIIAGYIIRIRLINEVLPIYLSMFLNSDYGKILLRGMAKGAVNQANINAQELKSIKIAKPPIELQNQFADFVKQVDKLKSEMEKKNLVIKLINIYIIICKQWKVLKN